MGASRALLLAGLCTLMLSGFCSAQWAPATTEDEAKAFIKRAQADPEGAFSDWAVACEKTYPNHHAQDAAFRIWTKRLAAAAATNADPKRTSYASMNCISDRPVPKAFDLPTNSPAAAAAAVAAAGNSTTVTAAASVVPQATGPIVRGAKKGLGFRKSAGTLFTSRLRSDGVVAGTNCPTDMDWRQVGGVTPVKDQGSCGSCWAFATTGAIEGANFAASGNLVDLSESQIVDCDSNDGACDGGLPSNAMKYVISAGGIMPTSAYGPYTPSKGTCKFDAGAAAVQLTGYTDIPPNDENALMEAVCNQPVTIALEASDAFMAYTGGIFNGPCGTNINHAVLVVGYGTDAATNTPYWIVKNSWTSNWGEGGYIRMQRGTNQCGMVNYSPSFPTVSGAPAPPTPPTPPPPEPPAPAPDGSCPPTYTVASGDTLFGIAAKYQINYLTLMASNTDITNPDLIMVGQVINLPCPPKIQCKAAVTVQSGDSIWAISQANGVGLQDMLAANPHFVNPDMIYPGDLVYVPPCSQTPETVRVSAARAAKAACRPTTYTAKAGDTPGLIAAAFNMQVGDVYRLNPALRRFATRFVRAGTTYNVLSCAKAARVSLTAPQSCKRVYTVVAGDTPTSVASKLGTTVSKIMVSNKWATSSRQALPARRKMCIN